MAALTVADVLTMPAVRNAAPTVLAGRRHLDRTVRWVHTTELPDIAPLLRGGDLVLTTGIALPDSPTALSAFARGLRRSDAAGLVIELGRRWTSVPEALVEHCERLGLPLVALQREVRFAAVTQAIGERLVDQQLTELREAQRVHDTFTELSIAEAGPEEILQAVQQLAGAAVVLESEQHQVLDYRPGPGDVSGFLEDWERRSRAVTLSDRTTWDESNGWLVTRLGRRERGWGRLVIEAPDRPTERLTAVAERAAAALALHRLHDRQRLGQTRRLHHELVVGLLTDPAGADVHRRARLAGFPVDDRRFLGLALRAVRGDGSPAVSGHQLDDLVAAALRSAEAVRAPALVTAFDTDLLVLLSLPRRGDPHRAGDALAAHLARRHPVVVAAGSAVTDLSQCDRTLREAQHVLTSVGTTAPGATVHRLEDVHIRGLLTLLADDDRLRAFVERELGALRQGDEAGTLSAALTALLRHSGSKSEAAAALNISRPVLYDRIAKVERLLGVDLSDAEVRTSLHVALLADEVAPRRGAD